MRDVLYIFLYFHLLLYFFHANKLLQCEVLMAYYYSATNGCSYIFEISADYYPIAD